MAATIQLVVGLANPGKEYAMTRHNAGAWFVEAFAAQTETRLKMETKFHGFYGQVHEAATSCHLLIPTTFMNASGQSVRACAQYLKLSPEQLLIVHDDIDLPVGTVRLKFDGGDGGHNGLKDIIQHLHTKQFLRLRIGVGRPKHSKDVIDYVLKNPSKAERQQIESALIAAYDILPLLTSGHIQQAMQRLHTQPIE